MVGSVELRGVSGRNCRCSGEESASSWSCIFSLESAFCAALVGVVGSGIFVSRMCFGVVGGRGGGGRTLDSSMGAKEIILKMDRDYCEVDCGMSSSCRNVGTRSMS
jgi:hypothetical protein